MKYSYPIKYAIMPIQTRDSRDGTPYTIYNIISKCYVLEERKKYRENGYSYTEYVVAFPFQNDCSTFFKKIYPDIYDACIIKNVYDSYDEAIEEKNKCNVQTLCHMLSSYDSYDEYLKVFEERNIYFRELEKLIEENTPELLAGMIPKTHKIAEVVLGDKSYRIFGSNGDSFYFNLYLLTYYKTHYNHDKPWNFIVYTLSDEEFLNVSKQLENKDFNCKVFMHTPLIMGTEGCEIVKLLSPSGEKYDLQVDRDTSWFSNKDMVDEPSDFELVIFTTETYIDVLNSFNLNSDIKSNFEISYQRQMWSLYKL